MSNKTIIHFVSQIKNSEKLTLKEKDILLNRIKGKTLEKIGKKYGLTAERIRQKEEAALLKLKKKIYQMILFNKIEKNNKTPN